MLTIHKMNDKHIYNNKVVVHPNLFKELEKGIEGQNIYLELLTDKSLMVLQCTSDVPPDKVNKVPVEIKGVPMVQVIPGQLIDEKSKVVDEMVPEDSIRIIRSSRDYLCAELGNLVTYIKKTSGEIHKIKTIYLKITPKDEGSIVTLSEYTEIKKNLNILHDTSVNCGQHYTMCIAKNYYILYFLEIDKIEKFGIVTKETEFILFDKFGTVVILAKDQLEQRERIVKVHKSKLKVSTEFPDSAGVLYDDDESYYEDPHPSTIWTSDLPIKPASFKQDIQPHGDHTDKCIPYDHNPLDKISIKDGSLYTEYPATVHKKYTDELIEEIITKVFLTRVLSKDVQKTLRVQLVKNILISGPPGIGKKYLLTNVIDALKPVLDMKPFKSINCKYVTSTFLTETFRTALEKSSEIFIVVLDKFEKIGTESMCEEILDNPYSNIIFVGFTDQEYLITEDILKKFEVHIKMPLPNKKDRLEILKEHTSYLKKLLNKDVNLDKLAEQTKNYTPKELVTLVKKAIAIALKREMCDVMNMKDVGKIDNISITHCDFYEAIGETKPIIGIDLEKINKILSLTPFSTFDNYEYETFVNSVLTDVVAYKLSEKNNIHIMCFSGEPGSGKSYLSAHVSDKNSFGYVKFINATDMMFLEDYQKANKLIHIFHNAQKSYSSLIVIDDIDIILEYMSIDTSSSMEGIPYTQKNICSNTMLQTLKGLFRRKTNGEKILVIINTSHYTQLKNLHLFDHVNKVYHMPKLEQKKPKHQSKETKDFDITGIKVI